MLGHDYIPVNLKSVAVSHPLQCGLENSAACVCRERASAMVAAEGDEVALSAVVETRQSPGHEGNLVCRAGHVRDV